MKIRILRWDFNADYPPALANPYSDTYTIDTINDNQILQYEPLSKQSSGLGFFDIEFGKAHFKFNQSSTMYQYVIENNDGSCVVLLDNKSLFSKYFFRLFNDDYTECLQTLFILPESIRQNYNEQTFQFDATTLIGIVLYIDKKSDQDVPYLTDNYVTNMDLSGTPRIIPIDWQKQNQIQTPVLLGEKLYKILNKGLVIGDEYQFIYTSSVDYIPSVYNMSSYNTVVQPTPYINNYSNSFIVEQEVQYSMDNFINLQTTLAGIDSSDYNTNLSNTRNYSASISRTKHLLFNCQWLANMYVKPEYNVGSFIVTTNTAEMKYVRPTFNKLIVLRRIKDFTGDTNPKITLKYRIYYYRILFNSNNIMTYPIYINDPPINVSINVYKHSTTPGGSYNDSDVLKHLGLYDYHQQIYYSGDVGSFMNDQRTIDACDAYILLQLRKIFQVDTEDTDDINDYPCKQIDLSLYNIFGVNPSIIANKYVYNVLNILGYFGSGISGVSYISQNAFDYASQAINGNTYISVINPYLVQNSPPSTNGIPSLIFNKYAYPYLESPVDSDYKFFYNNISFNTLWSQVLEIDPTNLEQKLMFTGNINAGLINPNIDNDNQSKYKLSQIVKGCIILLNGYLDINVQGNTIKLKNKPNPDSNITSPTVIIQDDVITKNIGFTLYDLNQFESAFNIITKAQNFKLSLEDYYDQVAIKFRYKINLSIWMSNYTLDLGDWIIVDNKAYIITKITKDYVNNVYQIEALGSGEVPTFNETLTIVGGWSPTFTCYKTVNINNVQITNLADGDTLSEVETGKATIWYGDPYNFWDGQLTELTAGNSYNFITVESDKIVTITY